MSTSSGQVQSRLGSRSEQRYAMSSLPRDVLREDALAPGPLTPHSFPTFGEN